MKVAFCDICGKKAMLHPHIVATIPVGSEWGDSSSGTKKQPEIAARIVLSSQHMQSGYTGPPDVCDRCLVKLADALASEARRRRKWISRGG